MTTTGRDPEFEREVVAPLRALVRRLRAYLFVRGAAGVSVLMVVAIAVQLGLDWSLRLPWDMRAALAALLAVGAGAALWRWIIGPLRIAIGIGEAACLVERQQPRFHSVLVSAVRFWSDRRLTSESNSPQLMDAVVRQACAAARGGSFTQVLRHGTARRSLIAMLAVLAALVAAFVIQPQVMGLWLERNILLGDAEWPKRTRLIVDLPGGVLRGALGDDLEIRARAMGVVPRQVELVVEYADDAVARENMIAVGERGFRHTLTKVSQPLRFRLQGGDDRTEWFPAYLTERPRIFSSSIRVVPPAYTRIPERVLGDGERAVEALRGSTLTLIIEPNKPVESATLMSGDQPVAPAAPDGRRWSVTITAQQSHTYHFALLDDVGLHNQRPARFRVRVAPDDPPQVRMTVPGLGDLVTPQAILSVETEFTDRYGLARAELVVHVQREGLEPQSLPLDELPPRSVQFSTSYTLPMSSLAVVPRDRVTFFARAFDFNDVSGPGEGRSMSMAVRVVSPEELLAELGRREQEYRQEFERLVNLQERLRGELLSVVADYERRPSATDLDRALAPLERKQRQTAGQVNVVRQQFERIAAELGINRLDTAAVQERLIGGIVEPLSRLAKRDLITAADQLRALSRAPSSAAAAEIDPTQERLLERMRLVLGNMLQWEGFQETVSLLQEILRLQGELQEETRREIERESGSIFDE